MCRGFTQVYKVDEEEKCTLTICYDTLYIFLAITTNNNWKIHQFDIVTAFLTNKLDEIIYLWISHLLQYLLRNYIQVLQNIYGLKQATYVWHILLEEFLKSIGFTPLPWDSSVFTNDIVIVNSRLILAVYVDDLLIAREYEKDIVYVK